MAVTFTITMRGRLKQEDCRFHAKSKAEQNVKKRKEKCLIVDISDISMAFDIV